MPGTCTEGERTSVDKSPDAFRTISEVAEDLDLPQHVLRFWETRFNQIRPMKRGGGRRYYRPDDVELLRGIRHLLYGQGYTIKGVQRILKEQGVRFVMDIWRNPGAPIPSGRARALPAEAAVQAGETGQDYGAWDTDPLPEDDYEEVHAVPVAAGDAVVDSPIDEPLPAGILPEGVPARSGLRLIDRLRGAGDSLGGQALSREDVRRLQSTLFELLECKRLLDQTR